MTQKNGLKESRNYELNETAKNSREDVWKVNVKIDIRHSCKKTLIVERRDLKEHFDKKDSFHAFNVSQVSQLWFFVQRYSTQWTSCYS